MSLAQRCARLPLPLRRSLAVLLLPVALLVAWLLVQPMLGLYQSQQQWRAEAQRLLSFSKSSVAGAEQLQQQIKAMQASPLWTKLYRPAEGATLATLQSDVGTLLTSVQATPQALTVIRATQVAGLTRTGVHLSAAMRIDQLQQLFSAAARQPRYLRIEQLSVTAPQTQSSTENPLLTVEMDIYGFELPAKPSARAPRQRPGKQ